MKTIIKAAFIITAAVIMINTVLVCRQAYSGLQQRYVSEAKGKAQAFISSLMY